MKRPIDILKTFFETGDRPTQDQFWDWLESFHHLDGGLTVKSDETLANGDIKIIFNDDTELIIPLSVLSIIAKNGLTKVGQVVKLGGSLTENTHIIGNNKNLTANGLGEFDVAAKNTRIVGDSILSLRGGKVAELKSIITTIQAVKELIILPKNATSGQTNYVLTNQDGNGRAIWAPVYIPQFTITSYDPTILTPSLGNVITIQGQFLDSIHNTTIVGLTDNSNIGVTILNKSFDTIEVGITANAVEQFYDLTLISNSKQETIQLKSTSQTVLIPTQNGVQWENVTGSIITSDGEIETSSTVTGWNKSATFGILPSNTDGVLSFTYEGGSSSPTGMAGFNSDPTTDSSYSSIDYAMYFTNGGNVRVYENGSYKGIVSSSIAVGDLMEVKRIAGVVTYYKNGALIYTSAVLSIGALHFDCSLYRNIKFSNLKIVY